MSANEWALGGDSPTLTACDIYINTGLTFNRLDYSDLPEGVIEIKRTGDISQVQLAGYLDVTHLQTGVEPASKIQNSSDVHWQFEVHTLPLDLAEEVFENLEVIRDSSGNVVEYSWTDKIGYNKLTNSKFVTICYYTDGEPAWDDPNKIIHVPRAIIYSEDGAITISGSDIIKPTIRIDAKLSDVLNSNGRRVRYIRASEVTSS